MVAVFSSVSIKQIKKKRFAMKGERQRDVGGS